jgi:iron complex outermembrane recepter protein
MLTGNYRRQALALAVVAALCTMGATQVHAQDATAATGNDNTNADKEPKKVTTLDQIKVTAQKREEVLQNVPVTMTTLPTQLLHDNGVHDIKDLQYLVSDLSVTSTSSQSQTTARIRGVGTVGDNPGLESSVGIVVDGVYRARNGVAFGDLGVLDQVEVLKGPQGTVFGKNTSAGLINVTTKAPTFNEEGYAELTVGNYNAAGVDAYYSNAIGKNAAFNIYVVDRKRDGFNDVNTGVGPRTQTDDGDQDFHSIRSQLLLTPSKDVEVRLIGDYTHSNENCCVGVTTVNGPTAPLVNALAGGNGVINVADPSQRLAFANRSTAQDTVDKGLSAEINWITPWLNNATFTSITSYRDWDSTNGQDLDYSGADIWYRAPGPDSAVHFRTVTQEFRLTGTAGRFDWMGGLYFDNEHLKRTDSITLGEAYEPYLSTAVLSGIAGAFPPGLVNTANAATFLSQAAGLPFGTDFVGKATQDAWHQDAKSTAGFGNVTFHATDALDFTAGARFTHEDKELDSSYTNPTGGQACGIALTNPLAVAGALAARGVPAPFIAAIVPTVIGNMCLPWTNPLFNGLTTQQDRSENEWSGTLKVAYRFNDTVMAYLSGARGYKAGGFNLDRVQSNTGLSSGTAGIIPVTDTSFPGEFVNSFELGSKTTWQDGNLLLNGALFHSSYTGFQLNSFLGTSYVVRSIPHLRTEGFDADLLWQTKITGLSVQSSATYTHAKYGHDLLPDAELALLPGNTASFAPKWQATTSIAYQWNFAHNLLGRLSVGAKYTTEYNTGSDLAPEKEQPSYTLVDARLAIGAKDKSWTVELWGENLTNRTYTQVSFDAPLQTGSYDAFLGNPRTYGVTVRLGF